MADTFGTDAGTAIRAGRIGVGLRNVGSYQISGHPFITGSTLVADEEKRVTFPYITKKITVIASGSQHTGLRVHFNSFTGTNVSGGLHYIVLNSHEDSMDFDVKCKEVYLSSPNGPGGFMLYASLTNVPTGSMYALTGSGLTDGPAEVYGV